MNEGDLLITKDSVSIVLKGESKCVYCTMFWRTKGCSPKESGVPICNRKYYFLDCLPKVCLA